ncbi:putative P450 monooxygenase [Cadophora sp. MPI-SDFR-AT-0126]|nr:putative P450 monooxygenase [Leotiomycetes sp. MPI-SDFR-AT-0126]
MTLQVGLVVWTLLLSWICLKIGQTVYNVFFHPLRAFPGPTAAKATTWWKTYIEVVTQESMVDVLIRLHKQFGEIVRVGPNELHFSKPSAYHEIYNASARWDKERTLYQAFGEDHSSFGLLTYDESKPRKDILQPMFSRRAILNIQRLVRQNFDHIVEVIAKNYAAGKSTDLLMAFRCFTVDTIIDFCFAKSVHAMDEPDFKAPIVEAMDASLPTFHLFKHFPLFRKTIFSLPPWLAIKASPETAGLTHLQVILGKQVQEVTTNPASLQDTPHPTIYHRLLDPDSQKGAPIPNATSLYEEAQTMVFAGGVTVGDTLMTGHFHILDQSVLYEKLKEEVLSVWPNINDPPPFEVFETLPLLTATIKESLRISPGATSPLLRIVPPTGAIISGRSIPSGTIVGMASTFVHKSEEIFESPATFNPYRWLSADSKGLEQHLVAFSKGPRSCLGINLAWCELYVAFATMLRRFDMRLDGTKVEDLVWRDCFTPYYPRRHLRVWCKPVKG